ncbi:MAG: VanZ family protein [Halieaceae bacterium]|nr:VanZ family protein [Halieaceae bacterium]
MAEHKAALQAWRWMLLFMLLAIAIDSTVPDHEPLGATRELVAQPGWRYSDAGEESEEGIGLRIASTRSNPFATLLLDLDETLETGTEFFVLDVCGDWAGASPTSGVETQGWVMLASLRDGQLDFNRSYAIWPLTPGGNRCARDEMPRRPGDGAAVLQVQLRGQIGSKLTIDSLTITAIRELPLWRWTRWLMLSLGLMLLLWRFLRPPYGLRLALRPRDVVNGAGLVVVAGIVFGCCVSVPLKADIFALLTGGRSLAAPADLELLLGRPFPLGGFSLFTFMHGVLFAAATLSLQLIHRAAWIDLVLLGAMTETLQRFVPGRGPGISDMLVDWSGVGLGLLLVLLLRRSHRIRLLLLK